MADALKQRGSLSIWLDTQMEWSAATTGKRGRQPAFSDAAIEVCLTAARQGIAKECPETG